MSFSSYCFDGREVVVLDWKIKRRMLHSPHGGRQMLYLLTRGQVGLDTQRQMESGA